MANDYKKDAMYVFGVVCANGVQDTWGDTLTKKDIKKLNSSFKNHETDTNHNFLKNIGVSVIENYITQTPMIVRGKDVPTGSWVAGMLVWDNALKKRIRAGELDGLSLCSRPDTPELMQEYINKQTPPNYRDIEDKDDLKPLFVSIVNGASNGYKIEYTTYSAYIERGKKEENFMSDNEFDKYLNFMEAVNTYIQRSNPAPQPQDNTEEIEELKKQLKETQAGFDEYIKQSNAKTDELMNAIQELKEKPADPTPKETNPEDEEGGEEGGGANPQEKGDENPEENPQGDNVYINRGQPNDFQSHGGIGNPEQKVVPVDKFFDDGFVPRNRGYGGLPIQ